VRRRWLIFGVMVFWSVALAANTCIEPKPLRVAAVCGKALDPSGAVVGEVELRLVTAQQAVVAKTYSDSKGDFMFSESPKGVYRLTTVTNGWHLGRLIEVTSSKRIENCKRPLYVTLGITACDGGVSKKK
jgi:hypothetical protein